MIEVLIGRPGSGKSYELTARALEQADRDRLVFTNYGLVHPNVFQFEPSQLLDLPPGLVVIDEAHLWFPARMALQLPMSWLAGMSQTRKKGWDMLLCAQHESRLDRVIRDVASWMWLCRAYGPQEGRPWLFTSTCWEPEKFRRHKEHVARRYRRFDPRVAAAYDTHETLTQADHTQKKADAYRADGSPAPAARGGRRNSSVLEAGGQ